MRYETLFTTASAVALLALTVGAFGAGNAGPDANGPVAMNALPHQPSQPASDLATTCQHYTFDNWNYRVAYVYMKDEGGWQPLRYEAMRVRLADGTTISHSASKSALSNPCPRSTLSKPIASFELPTPMTAYKALYCDKCDSRPAPPTWSQVAGKFPPPATAPRQHPREGVSHGVGDPGKYWYVETTYSWLITKAHPNGHWYFTRFQVKPSSSRH